MKTVDLPFAHANTALARSDFLALTRVYPTGTKKS